MNFCIAKQPVVDHSGNLAGYELLYRRAPSDDIAIIKNNINPTDQVLSGYFLLNLYSYDMDRTTYFINCDEEDLYSKNITLLPPYTTVIEILETCSPTSDLLDRIIQLRKLGYKIAFDDITPGSPWVAYLALADIAKIDTLAFDYSELMPIINICKNKKIKLLAEKVESEQDASLYRQLGFDFFQGYYFCKPLTINLNVLTPVTIQLLQSYSYLFSSEFNIHKFISIVIKEPSLVMMIISRANRHYRLMGKRISNIKHAIAYLGLNELKKIFSTIVASHISTSRHSIVNDFSEYRANFIELVTQSLPLRLKPYEGYSVGLLSMFDALLKVDMESLCTFMRLPEIIRDGLIYRKGFWGDMLKLCDAFENAQIQQTIQLSQKYKLEHEHLSHLYWKCYSPQIPISNE